MPAAVSRLGPTMYVETADTWVALCLGRGAATAVDGLPASRLPPPLFNGIKIASTHEKPIVSVKEGQCVGKRRGGGCCKGNQSVISVRLSPPLTWGIIPCYTCYPMLIGEVCVIMYRVLTGLWATLACISSFYRKKQRNIQMGENCQMRAFSELTN